MNCLLVLQFPASTAEALDALIALEEELEHILEPSHDVDGHDIGSGEMNLFIYTNEPLSALNKSLKAIKQSNCGRFVAAYRETSDGEFKVIHPGNYDGEFRIA